MKHIFVVIQTNVVAEENRNEHKSGIEYFAKGSDPD